MHGLGMCRLLGRMRTAKVVYFQLICARPAKKASAPTTISYIHRMVIALPSTNGSRVLRAERSVLTQNIKILNDAMRTTSARGLKRVL